MSLGHRFANHVRVLAFVTLDTGHVDQLKAFALVVQGVERIALSEIGFTSADDQPVDPTCMSLLTLVRQQLVVQFRELLIEQGIQCRGACLNMLEDRCVIRGNRQGG
ncbi:hypothetical protein D3C85_903650 [compost metagenome]